MSVLPGPQAARWWRVLQPKDEQGNGRTGDRGALARLRRASTMMQAASEPATLALCRELRAGEANLDRVALLAAVLAQVQEERFDLTVARQIGVQRDGTAIMSDLRFRRLLQADTLDERLIGFRRLVALAGRKLNVADLAVGLWHWGDEKERRRWIYAFHDAPNLPPGADAMSSLSEDASA
jgi:CRISPR type I-E-associated protein CasB/Cse2